MTPHPADFMDDENAPIVLAQPPPRKANIRDWQMTHPRIWISSKSEGVGLRSDWEALLEKFGEGAMHQAYIACQAAAKDKPVYYDSILAALNKGTFDPWYGMPRMERVALLLDLGWIGKAAMDKWREAHPGGKATIGEIARWVMSQPKMVEALKKHEIL